MQKEHNNLLNKLLLVIIPTIMILLSIYLLKNQKKIAYNIYDNCHEIISVEKKGKYSILKLK